MLWAKRDVRIRPWSFAHHLIWTAYGWWLPNDSRGSMSRFIASDPIAELGELHHGRKRRAALLVILARSG